MNVRADRFAAPFLVLVLVAIPAGPAFTAEVSLRLLPTPLWSAAVLEEMPPDLVAAVEGSLQESINRELRAAWPRFLEAGDARAVATEMERESSGLVHCGFRASRMELQRTKFGGDKTVFSFFLTGNLFLANLGTGEILAARTFTAVSQSEHAGDVQSLPLADQGVLAARTSRELVRLLTRGLTERVELGVLEAPVVGQRNGTEVVLAHGSMDGAYRGEGFVVPGAPGVTARVISVGPHLSVAALSKATQGLRGSTLRRTGVRSRAGDAPRLLVQADEPDRLVAPGVTAGEVASWVEDGLTDAGFAVVPSGAAFLASQLAEAATVNTATSALVGAQAVPDIAVLPSVVNVLTFEQHDEGTGSDLHVLEAGLALAFVDVRSGTVDFGRMAQLDRSEVLQEGGRDIDVNRSFPALIKDAAHLVAKEAAGAYSVRTATAQLVAAPDAQRRVSWPVGDLPLGVGTVAEVYRKGTAYSHPKTGEPLGVVGDLVGTLRVDASSGKSETGRVLAASVPLAAGMELRAVAGTRATERWVLALGEVATLPDSMEVDGHRVRDSTLAGIRVSPAFRSTIEGEAGRWVEALSSELSSGAFSEDGDVDLSLFAPTEATHRVDLAFRFDPGELTTRKNLLERSLTVTVEARVTDLATGRALLLVDPKGREWETYSMWKRRTLRARTRRGSVAVGLQDDDAPGQVEKLLGETVVELLRRIAVMTGRSG